MISDEKILVRYFENGIISSAVQAFGLELNSEACNRMEMSGLKTGYTVGAGENASKLKIVIHDPCARDRRHDCSPEVEISSPGTLPHLDQALPRLLRSFSVSVSRQNLVFD